MEKTFPSHMVPLGKKRFKFACHSGVACYTSCCRNVDMFLFPYDIIRLKNNLGVDSGVFLRKYVNIVRGNNPFFPSLMMKLCEEVEKACPFLEQKGCTVYSDRPSSCRTYPLERAVDREPGKGGPKDYYFLTNHPYCFGHKVETTFSVPEWIKNQQVALF